MGGKIIKKMRFGKESGDQDISVPGTPVVRKPLEEGVLGEANMDGSIYISDKIIPGSNLERQVVNHEMIHATDIKLGKLEYGDNYIMHDGVVYPRADVDGVDSIYINGKWKETGDHGFPWEQEANNGNGNI